MCYGAPCPAENVTHLADQQRILLLEIDCKNDWEDNTVVNLYTLQLFNFSPFICFPRCNEVTSSDMFIFHVTLNKEGIFTWSILGAIIATTLRATSASTL